MKKKSCNRHCCSLLGEIGSYKHICTLSFLGLLPLEDANGLIVNCVFSFPPTVVNRDLLGFLDCHTQGEAAHVPTSYGGFLPGGYTQLSGLVQRVEHVLSQLSSYSGPIPTQSSPLSHGAAPDEET